MVTKLVHRAAENAWIGAAIGTLGRVESRRPNLLRVLTYHQVDHPAAFRRQMLSLGERYRLPTCDQIAEALRGGPALPPRSLLVTFDDAHRSFGLFAWPVLRELGIPVILFVPTGFPDHPERVFWWDHLRHAVERTTRAAVAPPPGLDPGTPTGLLPLATTEERRLAFRVLRDHVKTLPFPVLLETVERVCDQLEVAPPPGEVHTREELLALRREGCELGAHSVTHPLLDDLPFGEARREVAGSRSDLERWTGRAPRFFAYPDGRYDRGVVDAVRESGFVAAFTTVGGTNDLPRADPLLLRRIHCDAGDSVAVLRARLLYGSAFLNRLRPLGAGSV